MQSICPETMKRGDGQRRFSVGKADGAVESPIRFAFYLLTERVVGQLMLWTIRLLICDQARRAIARPEVLSPAAAGALETLRLPSRPRRR